MGFSFLSKKIEAGGEPRFPASEDFFMIERSGAGESNRAKSVDATPETFDRT
jgi:hypothetical protein